MQFLEKVKFLRNCTEDAPLQFTYITCDHKCCQMTKYKCYKRTFISTPWTPNRSIRPVTKQNIPSAIKSQLGSPKAEWTYPNQKEAEYCEKNDATLVMILSSMTLSADKRIAVMAINKSNYLHMVNTLLNDDVFYRQSSQIPLTKPTSQVNKLQDRLQLQKKTSTHWH